MRAFIRSKGLSLDIHDPCTQPSVHHPHDELNFQRWINTGWQLAPYCTQNNCNFLRQLCFVFFQGLRYADKGWNPVRECSIDYWRNRREILYFNHIYLEYSVLQLPKDFFQISQNIMTKQSTWSNNVPNQGSSPCIVSARVATYEEEVSLTRVSLEIRSTEFEERTENKLGRWLVKRFRKAGVEWQARKVCQPPNEKNKHFQTSFSQFPRAFLLRIFHVIH